jgi:hypothetical protein
LFAAKPTKECCCKRNSKRVARLQLATSVFAIGGALIGPLDPYGHLMDQSYGDASDRLEAALFGVAGKTVAYG